MDTKLGLYFIGLPTMQPIKNVTSSIVDKVQLTQSNKMLAEDLKELEPVIRLWPKSNSCKLFKSYITAGIVLLL